MAIQFEILGGAGEDNALWVEVQAGQSVDRLLFDCGEGCVRQRPFADILAIDQLFFSHLHMDHVGGFDSFFRATFNRGDKPNVIWGPPESARILQGRFRGYLWNLPYPQPVSWRVREIHDDRIETFRFEIQEAFAITHHEGSVATTGIILDQPAYQVTAVRLEHRGPCLGYIVREKPRTNVEVAKLAAMGLRPGAWLKALKDFSQTSAEIDGVVRELAPLRRELLIESPGDSVAYLTDFLFDEAVERALPALRGCRVLVCESQYRAAELDYAQRAHHLIAAQAAELARRAGVEQLILFHVSERYTPQERPTLLAEARAVFPNTNFPERWRHHAGI